MLLVRPINEFPQPIAYKSHKVGMRMVKDLTLARRFIMQKLAVGVLNILEQLNREVCFQVPTFMCIYIFFNILRSINYEPNVSSTAVNFSHGNLGFGQDCS